MKPRAKLGSRRHMGQAQRQKHTKKKESLAVSLEVVPPRGHQKKKKIYWGCGMKRRTMMAIRHADNRSEMLELQWVLLILALRFLWHNSLMAHGANFRKG